MFGETLSFVVSSLSELKPVLECFLEILSGKYGWILSAFVAMGLLSIFIPARKRHH